MRPVRLPFSLLFLGVAGCASQASPQPAAALPVDPSPPLEERRISEFHVEFSGTPFDYRCGELEYPRSGAFICPRLGAASMVIRASGATQTTLAADCVPVPDSDTLQKRCAMSVAILFKQVEVLYPANSGNPPRSVYMTFEYYTPNPWPPEFFSPYRTYTLFLYPNADKKNRLFSDLTVLAIYPRDQINYQYSRTEDRIYPPWPRRE